MRRSMPGGHSNCYLRNFVERKRHNLKLNLAEIMESFGDALTEQAWTTS